MSIDLYPEWLTQKMQPTLILHVALLKPLRHCFDYLLPIDSMIPVGQLQPGIRLLVPFGKTQMIGVLLVVNQTSCISMDKLRPIIAILDEQPLISKNLLALQQWASQYYHHPIGDVVLGTLPMSLRTYQQIPVGQRTYQLTDFGKTVDLTLLTRTPKQAHLLTFLNIGVDPMSLDKIQAAGFTLGLLQKLCQKNWVSMTQLQLNKREVQPLKPICRATEPCLALNAHQQIAVDKITQTTGFQTYLLNGITGSGKTEVYLQAIDACLKKGKQALVLLPEIGLTPQTIARFEKRFAVPIVTLHSRLSEKNRYESWIRIGTGEARIMIGTRSALFSPFTQLGLIVVDEEHDLSFKQQTGFRYSARDLAVVCAQLEDIPIILGTATPSLETLHKANMARFQPLALPERAGEAILPTFHLIDLRQKKLIHGLSAELLAVIKQHLSAGNQVLLFLNRRGFAPILFCHECGWSAQCSRCDAKLTLHQKPLKLVCHHCTKTYPIFTICQHCQNPQLAQIGLGTQRIEQTLQSCFPDTEIIRIDRDSVRNKTDFEKILAKIQQGQQQILIGTQMLAKGHHFPNVTLVGIVEIDAALYSTDFRAVEHMGQLILQVAGRAGRAEKPGQVFLQTHQPDHPLLQTLIHQGYGEFANLLLAERERSGWPPFSYLGLLRAETTQSNHALDFLSQAKMIAAQLSEKGVTILGPIPAPMERKAGHFRGLLLFQANDRRMLHRWLTEFLSQLTAKATSHRVRWSIDVDPLELG